MLPCSCDGAELLETEGRIDWYEDQARTQDISFGGGGGGAMTWEAIYNLCFILKIML
jgi:hypothetical protein